MSLGSASNSSIEGNGNPWSPVSENSNDSTRSSSTQSWLDETEVTTTKELQEQYDKFEAALYLEEDASDLPKSLQDEVKIWSEHSPHIRVRGVKANICERPKSLREEEEPYGSDYEEILASHGSLEENIEKTLSFSDDVKEVIGNCSSGKQEVIKEDLKNAIVDRLFDQAWPKVLEKFEPVIKSMSARRKKTSLQSFDNTDSCIEALKNHINRNSASRCNSSRSYMREMLIRKPFVDSTTEYQSLLSSHGLRGYYSSTQPHSRPPVRRPLHKSAPKTCVNRTSNSPSPKANVQSYLSGKETEKRKPALKKPDQPIVLPPIEVLAITPQEPDKKCLSAWMRFSKTLPRVGSNSSKDKNIAEKQLHKMEEQKKKMNNGFQKRNSEAHLEPGNIIPFHIAII